MLNAFTEDDIIQSDARLLKQIKERDFINFGYENPAAVCKICYKKPARIEPRFGYAACIEHFHLTPIEFN